MGCVKENIRMESVLTGEKGSGIREFLERFIFFHLGKDADVDIRVSPKGVLKCSILHSRIAQISFELNHAQFELFSEDLAGFEDYLLELLTKNRRGLSKDD
jgi:hypothetical protein